MKRKKSWKNLYKILIAIIHRWGDKVLTFSSCNFLLYFLISFTTKNTWIVKSINGTVVLEMLFSHYKKSYWKQRKQWCCWSWNFSTNGLMRNVAHGTQSRGGGDFLLRIYWNTLEPWSKEKNLCFLPPQIVRKWERTSVFSLLPAEVFPLRGKMAATRTDDASLP